MVRLTFGQHHWFILGLQYFLLAVTSSLSSFYINHDAALYLQCGQLILEGKTPYVDFYDNNTPLIMYLSTVPVLISQVSALTVMQSFSLFVLIVILASTLAIYRIMARHGMSWTTTSILISSSIFMSLMTLVFHDFGQREHLFIALATPFFLVRFFRIQTGLIQEKTLFLAITGFCAGIGAALKPYFIVVILTGELVLFLKSRKRAIWICPELFGFIVFGLLYALVFACSPQIRTNYLKVLAPLISKGNSAYYAPSSVLWNSFNPLINKHSAYLFLAMLIFSLDFFRILFAIVKRKHLPSGMIYFMALAFMSFISYLYQAKGWYYHLIPFEFLTVYTFVLNLCLLAEGPEGERFDPKSLAKMALTSLFLIHFALTGIFLWRMHDQGRYWNSPFFEILQKTPVENNRVLVLSSSLTAYPYLLQSDKRPGSRFLWFFPIALLYSQSHESSLSEADIFANGSIDKDLEARFIQELVNDIQNNRPALIFMNSANSDQGLPKNFSFKNYLKFKKVSDLIEQEYSLDSQSFYTNDGAFYELWLLKKR